MPDSNIYETEEMNCILGDTIRPGGIEITDECVKFCKFSEGDSVLDIGCGKGITVEYLEKEYHLRSYGIDPSKVLLKQGKSRNPKINICEGTGENIPFLDNCIDGIFAECTLSLMNDLPKVLNEINRVLKINGWFIITDVYAKNPEYLNLLNEFNFKTCLRGLHDIEKLKRNLASNGFNIILFKDYSDILRELFVKIVFKYGSMDMFWRKTTSCSIDCRKFQQVLSKCKVGYFLMVGKKEMHVYE